MDCAWNSILCEKICNGKRSKIPSEICHSAPDSDGGFLYLPHDSLFSKSGANDIFSGKSASENQTNRAVKSLTTSPAMISPATDGTKAVLPGVLLLPCCGASDDGRGFRGISFE